jgi:hypothetical protein
MQWLKFPGLGVYMLCQSSALNLKQFVLPRLSELVIFSCFYWTLYSLTHAGKKRAQKPPKGHGLCVLTTLRHRDYYTHHRSGTTVLERTLGMGVVWEVRGIRG